MAIKKTIDKTCSACANIPIIGGILKPKPKISIIRLSGVIADSGSMGRSSINYARMEKPIEHAFDIFDLKAVFLIINSPGGSPAQSALIGNHIRRLSQEKEIPVYAFVEDVAASGGYWLACAADEIYATDVSIVGSIGVISSGFGFQNFIDRYGIERRIHTSGKDKSFLDPFAEEKPADVKRLSGIQKELHESFIDWVKERRGDKLDGNDKDLFEGQFWTGLKAKELGIIDGIEDAKSFAKEKFGDDIRFVESSAEKKLLPSLLGTEAKHSLAQDAIDTIETKAVWGRYGL